MTIAPIEADRPRPLGRGAKHESGISSAYYMNTLETTMTPNETSPDQAVEAVARAIRDERDRWRCLTGGEGLNDVIVRDDDDGESQEVSRHPQGDGDMYFYDTLDRALARAAIAAIPTPPPADHTDLIARLRGMVSSDGRAIVCNQRSTNGMCDDILAAADVLQAHASPREWQDIATAPRDATLIDVWAGDRRWTNAYWGRKDHFGRSPWGKEAWQNCNGDEPTHWMPRPAPPARTALELG